MSDSPRPEAIEAILTALVDLDPTALSRLTHLTSEERAAGMDAVLQVMQTTRGDRDRLLRVFQVLTEGGSRAGMSWEESWEVQPEANRQELVELYDVLPEGLLPFVDEWRARS